MGTTLLFEESHGDFYLRVDTYEKNRTLSTNICAHVYTLLNEEFSGELYLKLKEFIRVINKENPVLNWRTDIS